MTQFLSRLSSQTDGLTFDRWVQVRLQDEKDLWLKKKPTSSHLHHHAWQLVRCVCVDMVLWKCTLILVYITTTLWLHVSQADWKQRLEGLNLIYFCLHAEGFIQLIHTASGRWQKWPKEQYDTSNLNIKIEVTEGSRRVSKDNNIWLTHDSTLQM